MHRAEGLPLHGKLSPLPELLFDTQTCVQEIGCPRAWRNAEETGRRIRSCREWIRVRRIENHHFLHPEALEKHGAVDDRPRQAVVEDPCAGAKHGLLFAWSERQRRPGSEIHAIVERGLPVVARAQEKAEIRPKPELVLKKAICLIFDEGSVRLTLVHSERVRHLIVEVSEAREFKSSCKIGRVKDV